MWDWEKIKEKIKEFLKKLYGGVKVMSDAHNAYSLVGVVFAALGITNGFVIAAFTLLIAILIASFIRQTA
jgi:hypothetical protein